MRGIISVGAGIVIAAAGGAYAVTANGSDVSALTDIGCSIMFADGNPYWEDLSKTQLVEADKEVRQLPGQRGWLIVLHVDSQRDRLLADYQSAERKAKRAKNRTYYENLDPVTDVTQAVNDCIINLGEP